MQFFDSSVNKHIILKENYCNEIALKADVCESAFPNTTHLDGAFHLRVTIHRTTHSDNKTKWFFMELVHNTSDGSRPSTRANLATDAKVNTCP